MIAGVFGLLLCIGACSSSADDDKPRTFVVRGRVETGAHARAPVTGGYIQLLKPPAADSGGPWRGTVYTPTKTGIINADGTYRLTIERWALDFGDKAPIFIGASDTAHTFTLIAEIPLDLSVAGADLVIDINPSTTVAGRMICPGGIYPPPANTWCYSDPKTPSVDKTEMIKIIEDALAGNLTGLQTGEPPQMERFAAGFLNDPPTYDAIKASLTGHGVAFGDATPASITATIEKASVPRIAGAGGSTTPPTTGGCQLVWDCKASTQCASVYGKPTGSSPQPDANTCASTCKAQGACTCQGC
jgi:hypothetical protein